MHTQHTDLCHPPHELEKFSPPLRILIVDDEPIIRVAVADILERRGHKCVEASSIKAAVELVHGQTFDAALLDVTLDDTLTSPVVRALQDKGVHCILLTAYTRSELPASFAGLRLVEKPFWDSAVIDALEDCGRNAGLQARATSGLSS